MAEIKESILALAKKLKALADNGVDGEKENAAQMLERFMSKHEITMDMLEENKISDHFFLVEDEKYKFFRQTAASVVGKVKMKYKRGERAKNKSYWVECTELEAIEIRAKYEFFYAAWVKEMEVFYSAFIQKNHLYQKQNEDEDEREYEDLTAEEKARLFRMAQLMEGMERHVFVKQLKG